MADRILDFDRISKDIAYSSDDTFDVGTRNQESRKDPEFRDPSQDINDRKTRYYKQYENDIFFIHDPEIPKSSHIAIRESQIGMHVKDGKVGILMTDSGDVRIQGKIIFKANGENIVKGIYTENPLSFMPSTIATPIPSYLFSMPSIGLVDGIMSLFEQFNALFK